MTGIDEIKKVMNNRSPLVWLVTAGLFHPTYLARVKLGHILKRVEGLSFRHTSSLERLPSTLEEARAVVLYIHQQHIRPETLEKLRGFVRAGGGLLGIHSATASFKQAPSYFEIIGGRFTGHGPVHSFEIQPVESAENPYAGLPGFTLTDELYFHDLQPGIQARFTCQHANQAVPVIWTYAYGAGRVCYAGPGHRAASFDNPVYQEVLRRSLAWVARVEEQSRWQP